MLHHSNGTTEQFPVNHSYNKGQIGWFKAGSALNLMAARFASDKKQPVVKKAGKKAVKKSVKKSAKKTVTKKPAKKLVPKKQVKTKKKSVKSVKTKRR